MARPSEFASPFASLPRWIVPIILAISASLVPGTALCQIFETNFNPSFPTGSVGEYDLSGGVINSALISHLNGPVGIAVSGTDLYLGFSSGTVGQYTTAGKTVNASLIGYPYVSNISDVAVFNNDLYVVDLGYNRIGVYDRFTGAPINVSLVSGLNGPASIAFFGGNLFVSNFNSGVVGEYNATTGLAVDPSFITGLPGPAGLAVIGADLYVVEAGATANSGLIAQYDAITGTAINPTLVTGLNDPRGLAAFGTNLYVADRANNRIGEYDAITGATINANLVTGLSNPFGIAVVPEPSTWVMIILGSGLFAGRLRWRG